MGYKDKIKQMPKRRATKQKKKKKERSFADYIVFASIIAVSVFTTAAFILQFEGLMEISATLTTCWFAFWTVEIVSLAAIKTGKVKYDYKKAKKAYQDDEEGTEENDDGVAG